ncbi:MAG TPA: anthranilate synthase component I [Desulfuromonadales bacterium]|nr:anthranilate synthase component I [Desulfuromonadales bacterium]
MCLPSRERFKSLSVQGNLVPIYREILADMETPVSALKKIDDGRNAFLLESLEGGEKWARYSFLGTGPGWLFRSLGNSYEILDDDEIVESGHQADPFSRLRDFISDTKPVEVEGLPRFFGGAVGYLGYDMVRFIERLPDDNPRKIGTYDSCFLLTENLLIFDNQKHTIKVVSNVRLKEGENPEVAYDRGLLRIDSLIEKLRARLPERTPKNHKPSEFKSDFTRNQFMQAVEKAKEYVRSGDIIQVVLSQRFSAKLDEDPFDIYRALRVVNPSPYMFFLRFGATQVVGASPEVLVRQEGDVVDVRPIAGTRPRGRTEEEDRRFEEELLADPKELAEHIMLVDLGRNDLGRVCRAGSVKVTEFKVVERYSHVMHIVSNVRARLEAGNDSLDVFRAVFPAGTLSGAPKIRAMEIIDELENSRREIYGGAVGYLSFSGNMDMAIAIRTLVVHDGTVHLQAGAGIVADSDPETEYQETLNKAKGVMKAIEMVQKGLE